MTVSRRMRLGANDLIIINDTELRWVSEQPAGHVFRLARDPELFVEYTHEELWRARTGNCSFFHYEEDHFLPGRAAARLRGGVATFADVPHEEQALIDLKLRICEGLDRLLQQAEHLRGNRRRPDRKLPKDDPSRVSKSDDGIALALKILWPQLEAELAEPADGKAKRRRGGREKQGLDQYGPQAVRGWYNQLVEHDWDPLVLRMGYRRCGRHGSQVSLDCERLMARCAQGYASETKPTKRQVYDDLRVAVDDHNRDLPAGVEPVVMPSMRTFSERIEELDPFQVCAARHGIKKAKQKYRVVTQGVAATRPGERVEMDEAKMHLQTQLVDKGLWDLLPKEAQQIVAPVRIWYCAITDCASRVLLGVSASLQPSTDSVLEAVRMTVSDKSSTATAVGALARWDMAVVPEQIVTDNGATMVNGRVRVALAGLGVRHTRTIAGEPSMRGTIERLFRTINTRIFRRFTGQTFENVVARGDYPAEKRASLTTLAIVQILLRAVVDDYHNRPHSGLGGETPTDAYRRLSAKYGEKPLPSSDVLRAIFGVEVTRVVGPHGVRVFGLNYQLKQLQDWHRSTRHDPAIPVKVDRHDLGRVSVKVGDTWIPLYCVSPGLEGQSLNTWQQTVAELRARFAKGAKISEPVLLEAIRAAQAMARQGLEIFGLTETWWTPEQIERADRNMDVGWTMPGRDEPPDLLDDSVPSTGPDTPMSGHPEGVVHARDTVENDTHFGWFGGDPVDDGPAVPEHEPPIPKSAPPQTRDQDGSPAPTAQSPAGTPPPLRLVIED